MRAPERRREAVVDIPRPSPTAPSAPLEPTRDVGWLIGVVSAVGALVAYWTLFPPDATGMWAGYWVSIMATTSLLGSMWLRTSLPTAPGVAITAVPGGILVLLGALRDYPATIGVVMVAGGAGILVGGLLQARRSPRTRS
ncbi:hypothetical protein GCM10009844_17030 [Nocardioides koreensis]|uniref:EamA domain-containing protein n=1 Tax=Nocardioides koreensis TaxID=433651 RepID=A0ABN2ZLI1_9ACTN